jgi:hypothetical protein
MVESGRGRIERAMIEEADDPILDALLDEVLADRRPPDLAAQIMRAWGTASVEDQTGNELAVGTGTPVRGIDSAPTPEPPPILHGIRPALVTVDGLQGAGSARRATRQRSKPEPLFAVLAISAAAAAIGLGLSIWIGSWPRPAGPQIAEKRNEAPPRVSVSKRSVAKRDAQPANKKGQPPVAPQPVEPARLVQEALPPADSSAANDLTAPPQSAPPQIANSAPGSGSAAASKMQRQEPSPDAQVVSFVNAELTRVWKEAGVKPSAAASDADWCRRVFQRVLGRSPSSEELKALADDKSAARREKLVDRLLNEPKYNGEFARHWSAILTGVLLGNGGRGSWLASEEDLRAHIAAALKAGKRYDALVEELLIATGTAGGNGSDYNPAVNFLLADFEPSTVATTGRVARVLLGHQLQCAQCHAHPTREWTQDQFWALNAALAQVHAERAGETNRLVNREPRGADEVVFETPDGIAKSARPTFLDGTELKASDAAGKRRELARLIVESNDFARAAANRIWSQLFDYGFTRPVDDLGPQAESAAPQVLDRLAIELAAHDYDLKRFIRWAILSEAFARSSKLSDLASKDMPEEGELALFSRFYDRPPQSVGVMNAVVQAARIRTTTTNRGEVERARIDWLAANRMAKGPKAAPPATGPAVLVQTADLRLRPASGDPTGLVKRIAASQMAFDKKVEHLFLAALDRPPTPREQQAARQLEQSNRGNSAAALDDLWWALLNSNECVVDRLAAVAQ